MIAGVIVDIQNSEVDRVFDYSVFDDVKLGSRVLIPFGKKQIEGFIIELKQKTNVPKGKLKSIIKVLDDEPILNVEMLELMQYMTSKYNLKKIDCIKLFLPSGLLKGKVKTILIKSYKLTKNYEKNAEKIKKTAKNQLLIIEYLKLHQVENQTILNQMFSSSSVKKLEELNIIEPVFNQKQRKPNTLKIENKVVKLTNLQQKVLDDIVKSNGKTFLLHGVTGSGKTEVYMNVIENVLKENKTAIMLVPEISLTPQVMQNFVARFGENVAILHSGLTMGERFDEWQRIKKGEAKIVVGARSAVFAPLKNIGVIIIDEEHDSSYYSENNPRYFTHEVAQFRAKYNNCNLILGSATPSIDDYYKANIGEYVLEEMPIRVNSKDMPNIEIVDMLSEIRNGNSSMFSNMLINKLTEKIANGEQVMLFLNRRGYSSFIRCTNCGYIPKCEDCDVSLVYHKEDNQLKCHYCGRRYHMLSCCPDCKNTNIRHGAVGTQQVESELKKHFENLKVFRLDNDTAQTKNSHEEILSEFAKTKPSVLVGTQMIAKGHDFPLVTLVGIIDADVSLHFSDYRASERTFNLITQVAGRAGRSERQGEVVLQTYMPKHFVYRIAQEYNYKKFYERELNLRMVTNFPPFVNLLRVLITSEKEEKAKKITKNLFENIEPLKQKYPNDFVYLNAMKSPVKRIEKKYRYQILMRIKTERYDEIIKDIFEVKNKIKSTDCYVFIEQNPQNLS